MKIRILHQSTSGVVTMNAQQFECNGTPQSIRRAARDFLMPPFDRAVVVGRILRARKNLPRLPNGYSINIDISDLENEAFPHYNIMRIGN